MSGIVGTKASREDKLRTKLHYLQRKAARHLESQFTNDGDRPWTERTVRDVCSLALAQGTMAAERARTTAEAPKVLGLVFMPPKIEGNREWEQLAASTGKVIDAVAIENKDKK